MQTFFSVAESMGCLQSENRNQKRNLCVSAGFSQAEAIICNCSAGVTVWGHGVLHSTALPGRKAKPAVMSLVFQSSAGNWITNWGLQDIFLSCCHLSSWSYLCSYPDNSKNKGKEKKAPNPTYPIYACIRHFIKLCYPHSSVSDWACASDGASYCFRYLTPKGA